MRICIIISLLMPLALLLSSCASTKDELPPVSKMPPTVSKEGTLANATLVEDTTKAIFDGLRISESERANINVVKFVMQQPVGPEGKKAWREFWILMKDGKAGQSFTVTFREDGKGSANFVIEGKMMSQPRE